MHLELIVIHRLDASGIILLDCHPICLYTYTRLCYVLPEDYQQEQLYVQYS